MTETSSKKTGGCWLPAIGAAVLVGGGAAYWALRPSGGDALSAAANATALPDETIAIAHLDPASFDKIAEFGTPAVQAEVREIFASGLAEISPDLDWERDLKPWVGSVTLGLATPIEGSEDGEAQAYVAIGIRNKVKAWQFAQGLQAEAGDEAVKTDYNGTEIIQVSPDENGSGETLAVVNDRLLVTNSLATMQNAIDDASASRTASKNPEIQRLLNEAETVAAPILRVYIPDTSAFAEIETGGDAAAESVDRTESAAIRSSIATLNVTDSGLHGEVEVQFDADRELPEFAVLSDRAETQFPAGTLLLLAGNGLGKTWTQFVARAEAADAPPEAVQALGTVREAFASLGLDADREVFAWLDGEAAIGAFPVESGLLQQLGIAAAATVETSDRQAASATLGKLAKLVNDRVPVPLREDKRQVGEVEVQEWTIPVPGMGSGALFGYGWRDDRNLVVGLSSPAIDAVSQPAATSLSNDANFQDVMNELSADKSGYAYLNLAELDRRLQNIPVGVPNTVSPEVLVALGAARGLGLTLVSEAPDRLAIEMSLALTRMADAAEPDAAESDAAPE
ncbi:MAG: DUF3352 domain-containing protein [Geitlerinemataceae cyanobacterium]